ncbi:RagB/SusD family nutrient uptake outer membrane protein [Pedobacter sp. AW1-32]|uniref:RagB/SusD family nutrient uptake outer membrane protein n=1 Tax=Pedobacter sp. AW1-32 TaxID=3383026 RepID=UPI003FEEC9D4
MKKIYICFLTLALSVQFGCQKYLDIQPKGYVVPSTVEDFEKILEAKDLQWPFSTILDVLSDDYYNWSLSRTNIPVTAQNQAYQWSETIFSTSNDLLSQSFYNRLYANIYQFNAVINNIDNATGGTESRKTAAKAKARALRAFSFLYLVNLYAKQYNPNTSSTDPGIPLVYDTNISQNPPDRGTVQGVYDYIISEINASLPNLPSIGANYFEMTKGAAYGTLARAYLYMGNYAAAGEAASQALTFQNGLIDYNNEFSTYNGNGLNFIYTKTGSLLSQRPNTQDIFIRYHSSSLGMYGFGVSLETVALFPENDLRRIVLTPSSVTTATPAIWNGNYYYMAYSTVYQYSIGITVPEMLLVRAEANARLGNLSAAMTDLNLLRKARIRANAYTALAANTVTDAVKLVLLERRKELFFKGARWFDMRRLSADPVYGFTARHYFADGTFIELTPGSNRYVLRLPESAITDGIIQNP